MKRSLMVLGVFVVCLPMLFVGWLMLAAHWPKMDASTRHMPEGLRSLVVQAMLQTSRGTATEQRATKLDAEATQEWKQRNLREAAIYRRPKAGESVQMEVDGTLSSAAAAKLNQIGLDQEKAGDECGAEETFTKAAGKSASGTQYAAAENMGRAALRCGDLPSARAGLETAIIKQEKLLEGSEENTDDARAAKIDMLKDREFLIVIYQREHEKELSATACSEAHPDWKGCACALDAKGDVTCHESRR